MRNGKHSSSPDNDYTDIYSSRKGKKESIDIYSSSKRPKKGFNVFIKVLLVIECLIMIGGTLYIATMNLLPANYIFILVAVVAVVCGIQAFLKLRKSKRNKSKVISIILTVLILVVNFFAVSMLGAFQSSMQMLTQDEEVEVAPNAAKVTKEPFMVYLSGSDSRDVSTISEKGLSDVNMVIAVDPETHKILMVNTPRDFYVALWGDQNKMDKLTHAGAYGIECSMETLEALYDIEFNYYARINFKSVVDIVDALGGITVNSEVAFNSSYSLSGKNYSFVVGENQLNGDAALAFARERKSFAGGDRQRGKNQQQVISGIVDKAISPSILNPSKFKELLTSVTGNTKTNISNNEINDLFKMQLKNMKGWDVQSISVDGTGASYTTYTYPNGRAYVMIPNEETVTAAKTALTEFKE